MGKVIPFERGRMYHRVTGFIESYKYDTEIKKQIGNGLGGGKCFNVNFAVIKPIAFIESQQVVIAELQVEVHESFNAVSNEQGYGGISLKEKFFAETRTQIVRIEIPATEFIKEYEIVL